MQEKTKLFLIPTTISLLLILASLLGLFSALDWSVYDLLLHFRREPAEYPAILLADFDDPAIEEIGAWPIGRDVAADGLATMAELGASTAVFDIEYVNTSPRGINTRYLDTTLPEAFKEGFGGLSENIRGLFGALANKQIPLSEAEGYIEDLAGLTDAVRKELLERVRLVAADNDERLGRAAEFFGQAYFTVNMRTEPSPGDADAKKLAVSRDGEDFPEAGKGLLPVAKDIIPTIPPILSRSAGAGFPNVYVDPADGVRRRIELFCEFEGKRFGQLVLVPLLDRLGKPEVEVRKDAFILKKARLPDGSVSDIRIPRAEDGRMLINWPHKNYLDSFRHVSFREFVIHEKLYDDLVHNLRIRDDWGYLSAYDGEIPLLELAQRADDFRTACLEGKDELPPEAPQRLREFRDAFLDATEKYLAAEPDRLILEQVDAALNSGQLDPGTEAQYRMIRADVPVYFEKTRNLYRDLSDLRRRLREELAGAFCIIGWTATGTTDIGVNPFSGEYVNVGTHAAVANTILQRSFIDDSPAWLPLLIAAILSFGLTFVIQGRKPVWEIGIGIAVSLLIAGCLGAVFIVVGRFVPPSAPILASFFTFLTVTIVSFLQTEREKGFLRNAFSHYLSTEVIKEIVADPSKLKLGGTKRLMTAMFTDIRGFSTVSEKLSPENLVRLLNRYLSGMSDVILDLKGTIDKYEGDAIIAFFGAPVDLPDHAHRACAAAIRMKHLEAELNKQFLADGIAPSPLLTRLGLNTGDMVVGNMGTERKMDYTIIGDAVNLAARLEGVNKQYGTWICVSEDSVAAAGEDFLFRCLDRIRVVGKSQPIRIYELVDERSALKPEDVEFYARFEEGLKKFENRDWQGAIEVFIRTLKLRPEDGPSKVFKDRSAAYAKSPPPANWDGVYNLTVK